MANNEWIEIYNPSSDEINLSGWSIDDEDGGSKIFRFEEDLLIKENGFYQLKRKESGLALNNDADRVRIYNSEGKLIMEVEYAKAKEGTAYAYGKNGQWFWTGSPTPGKENIIKNISSDAKIVTGGVKVKGANYAQLTNFQDICDYDKGDHIKAQGEVIVLPGIFGSQYFYIAGTGGVQIYNYNKHFPKMNVGDLVEVNGELSFISDEPRIKTKSIDDIKVLGPRKEINPKFLACDAINSDNAGELIVVDGEITEIKGSTIFLDDGSAEIPIYLKKTTGLTSKIFKEGQQAKIAGILIKSSSGLKLMPRGKEDIAWSGNRDEILGEVSQAGEWQLAQRDKKKEIIGYTAVILFFILAGIIIFILKNKPKISNK